MTHPGLQPAGQHLRLPKPARLWDFGTGMTRRSAPKANGEPAWAALPDEALLKLSLQDPT